MTQKNVSLIANTQVKCAKELHDLQMENEAKRSRNLDKELELLNEKIIYYKKKTESVSIVLF